jgi:hypothetical protein
MARPPPRLCFGPLTIWPGPSLAAGGQSSDWKVTETVRAPDANRARLDHGQLAFGGIEADRLFMQLRDAWRRGEIAMKRTEGVGITKALMMF